MSGSWRKLLGASVAGVAGVASAQRWITSAVNQSHCEQRDEETFDIAVVGGGVVGLAVARECAVRGNKVVLLEKEDAFAAGASSGNSGLGCTGYDAPVGSLERKLLRRSIRLHQHLYRSFGLSHDHVRKSGSLVVAWNQEQLAQLPQVLQENRDAGDMEAELLSKDDLARLEPALSSDALGAVLCPYEAVVEPWLVPIGYAENAIRNGATLVTNTRVERASFDPKERYWTLSTTKTRESSVGRSEPGKLLVNIQLEEINSSQVSENQRDYKAKVVINCAGLYGDLVEQGRGSTADQVGFKVTPRKGQFVVFKPKPDTNPREVPSHIVEPVATQFTKGVIAWTTVYGNIIVGPTAVDQTSKTDRSTDTQTVQELVQFGQKVLPVLKDACVVGTYSGLRPATEHRDYQIKSDASQNWITVAGIRSTGLTASSGIGEYVADLYQQMHDPSYIPWALRSDEKLLGVSESATSPLPCSQHAIRNPPVPTLAVLARDYQSRGDGTVSVYGRLHRVTHPIASFGMETFLT